jgi:hypothetical protein
MHIRGAGAGNPASQEGIVARSSVRFAAGVGVVAASLILGPAVAAADDGGSGSPSSDDRGVLDGGGNDGFDVPGVPGIDLGTPDLDRNPTLGDLGPATRVGAGRIAEDSLRASENLTIAEQAAPGLPGVIPGSGPSARSGSDLGRAPAGSGRTPRVRIGNGRPPVVRHRDFDPPSQLPVTPAEVAPPAPERVVIDLPQPPQIDRGQPPRLMPKLGAVQTSSPSDPLFGLAGLLLIPAVGAALGYRQARAAQDAARSGRP